MKKSLLYSILFICFISSSAWAGSIVQQQQKQHHTNWSKSKDISIVTGFQSGRYNFAEIGLGIKNELLSHHFFTSVLMVSNEFRYNGDFVWGFKTGGWISGGAGSSLGLNLINYTNFQQNTIYFRPEIGIGFGAFRMFYGFNTPIINKNFRGINEHLFGINILLDIKNLKTESSLTSPPLVE